MRQKKRKQLQIRYPEHSACKAKNRYATADLAGDAGRTQMYNNGFKIQLYIYPCDYCQGYHLTQTPTDMPA